MWTGVSRLTTLGGHIENDEQLNQKHRANWMVQNGRVMNVDVKWSREK